MEIKFTAVIRGTSNKGIMWNLLMKDTIIVHYTKQLPKEDNLPIIYKGGSGWSQTQRFHCTWIMHEPHTSAETIFRVNYSSIIAMIFLCIPWAKIDSDRWYNSYVL